MRGLRFVEAHVAFVVAGVIAVFGLGAAYSARQRKRTEVREADADDLT